ncbi:hypothetical protein ACIBTV_25430 [Micromonospora sp. NPDC049366]|uniref:hypothetical protein n=1 Tax=Micromonospora sp. NPDC049366 TaxID=3364271 RepID=UPI0037AABA46
MSAVPTVAPVTRLTATTGSDAPFTVTATIETGLRETHLIVVVDGEPHCFRINRHWLRLEDRTVTDEATRLLQRHAAYQPATEWSPTGSGTLTATVAEISGRCRTCAHNCDCMPGSNGCGHFGCPFAAEDVANTCDGADIHLQARRPRRKRIAHRHVTR